MKLNAANLKTARALAGLSGAFVARQIGITAQGFYYVEAGRNGVSVDKLFRLSRVLGVQTQYLTQGV